MKKSKCYKKPGCFCTIPVESCHSVLISGVSRCGPVETGLFGPIRWVVSVQFLRAVVLN